MLIFYRATIELVLRYGIACWFGNLTVKSKAHIFTLIRTEGKIIGRSVPLNPQHLFEQAILRKTDSILNDSPHVLRSEHILLNLRRRYRVTHCFFCQSKL